MRQRENDLSRRQFVCGAAAFAAGGVRFGAAANAIAANCTPLVRRSERQMRERIDNWDAATALVEPEAYSAYLKDGNTRGFKALKVLDDAFDKVLREAKETVEADGAPAVWSVYNMGNIVKTRKSLFSIDLNHRRGKEFAPLLDFALVTHKHGDHWRRDFYKAMDSAGKTVISNFLCNKGASECGYAPGEKVFKIKDVEIRTFRVYDGV